MIKFLAIDEVKKELEYSKASNNTAHMNIKNDFTRTCNSLRNDISHFQQSVNTLHKTVENVVHIGTDIGNPASGSHSWAVVCIEGKINVVKFIDLDRRYIRDILDFLKQFEAGRHCIDAPHKGIFDQELFKF